MRYPKIPNIFLNVDVDLTVTSNKTSMTGSPEVILKKKFKCNYQSANDKNSSDFERGTGVTAVIIISGNIFKNDTNQSCGGSAVVMGVKHTITNISLVRNPDGTVNYTRITTK